MNSKQLDHDKTWSFLLQKIKLVQLLWRRLKALTLINFVVGHLNYKELIDIMDFLKDILGEELYETDNQNW